MASVEAITLGTGIAVLNEGRPEALLLRDPPTAHSVTFELDVVEPVEPDTLLFVKQGDVALVARIMRDMGERAPGAPVHLELPPEQRHFFSATTGARLP